VHDNREGGCRPALGWRAQWLTYLLGWLSKLSNGSRDQIRGCRKDDATCKVRLSLRIAIFAEREASLPFGSSTTVFYIQYMECNYLPGHMPISPHFGAVASLPIQDTYPK
jgi:hypothetical protein